MRFLIDDKWLFEFNQNEQSLGILTNTEDLPYEKSQFEDFHINLRENAETVKHILATDYTTFLIIYTCEEMPRSPDG